jgi:hypothetical protein
MKSERHKAGLGMTLVIALASLLVACAMEGEGDENVPEPQSALTPDESFAVDESITSEEASSAEDAVVSGEVDEATVGEDVAAAPVGCREVTTYRVKVYKSPEGTGTAYHGYWYDRTIFQHYGIPPGGTRYYTWWPGGLPPGPGTEPAYVPPYGTSAVTCP